MQATGAGWVLQPCRGKWELILLAVGVCSPAHAASWLVLVQGDACRAAEVPSAGGKGFLTGKHSGCPR